MQAGTYSSQFISKDVRRGHCVVIECYLGLCEGEYEFFGRGSDYEQGWPAQFLPEFREHLLSIGIKPEPLTRELTVMLELALPLDRDEMPFMHEDVENWMGPKFMVNEKLENREEINDLMKRLPDKLKLLLSLMPETAADEDPRVSFMHACTYWRDFSTRYHEAKAVIHEDNQDKKKQRQSKTQREAEEMAFKKATHEWAEKTEKAMKTMCPSMGEIITRAEIIEGAKAELERKAAARASGQ